MVIIFPFLVIPFLVAVKLYPKNLMGEVNYLEECLKEAKLLSKISNHPNIVKFMVCPFL